MKSTMLNGWVRGLVMTLMMQALAFAAEPATGASGWKFDLPAVKEPVIPANQVSVADFGAVPDGKTLNTEAIAKAIDACVAKGGGRVVFPAGLWLTGPIKLKSNIDLHVELGALIKFSTDLAQYPNGAAPISGSKLENVAITGDGIIDGSGEIWRPLKKEKTTERQWKEFMNNGGVLDEGKVFAWPSALAKKTKLRPRMVKLGGCHRVLLEGATFRNSPSFHLDISDSDDVTIRNVTVFCEWWAQNGDGIDLHSCRNVVIRGARVSAGDDGICMKSSKGKALENILVEDCTVYHAHGGFVIGSEELGGVHNIRVNNCTFIGTDTGLRFKSSRSRGNVVEKIDIRNVRMTDIVGEAILFDLYYENQAPLDKNGNLSAGPSKPAPVTPTTPQFRDISIRDVICRGARQAIQLQGLPEMATKGISLENVSITADRGAALMDVADIAFKNVEILNAKGPVLNFFNAKGVAIDGLTYPAGAESLAKVQGPGNSGIAIKGTNAKAAKVDVELTDGAKREAIKID